MTWIQVRNIQKQLDDFKIGPIHLNIDPGTITALVGDNGAGKSTFLKIIMNLIHYEHGEIHIFGTPNHAEQNNWKAEIAYLPQKQTGMDPYTGNTLKHLYALTYPSFDLDKFNHLIGKFKVNLRKKYQKLSPGEQQKLRIALTLATNVKILILDEPTSFIDIQAKTYFFDALIKWMDEAERSIILSTHQVDEIRKLADYIVPIRRGEMLGNYEKEALINHYREYSIQGEIPTNPIPGEAKRKGQTILSNAPHQTEAFLKQERITIIAQNRVELEEVIAHTLELESESKGESM